MLRVEDLMTTALVTVRPDEKLEEALDQMRLAVIRHLVVVDGSHRVVGICTNSDFVDAMADKHFSQLRVRDAMTADVVTVQPDTPAHAAVAQMLERRIAALPVVDEAGCLIGIVTATDFLNVAEQALRSRRADEFAPARS